MQYQSISMQNRYFAYFSDFSHIGVDFRILICEFAYAWRPCYYYHYFILFYFFFFWGGGVSLSEEVETLGDRSSTSFKSSTTKDSQKFLSNY